MENKFGGGREVVHGFRPVQLACGSVTVVGATAADAISLDIIGRGAGFIAVNWGGTKVVGVYSSPDGTMENLESLLRWAP